MNILQFNLIIYFLCLILDKLMLCSHSADITTTVNPNSDEMTTTVISDSSEATTSMITTNCKYPQA